MPKETLTCPITGVAAGIAAALCVNFSPEVKAALDVMVNCQREHCAMWCHVRNCCGLKHDVGETLISSIDDDGAYGDEPMIIRDEDDKP